MSEQELAALQGAADEAVISSDDETSEATENTPGQVADQPAEVAAKAEAEEKTKSQIRRERREAAERRLKEEQAQTAQRLADAEARIQRIKAAAQAIAEPKEADFQDPIEYAAAKGAWAQAQMATRLAEAEVTGEAETLRKAQKIARQQHLQELHKDWSDGMADARSKYGDFDQALAVAANPAVVSQDLSLMVLESEAAHDLTYYLGKNPEKAQLLSRMNPVQAARELGRIEAALAMPKPTTKAPEPIAPVRGGVTPNGYSPNMSYAEFCKWREAGGTFKL